jgi:hypothetical protein
VPLSDGLIQVHAEAPRHPKRVSSMVGSGSADISLRGTQHLPLAPVAQESSLAEGLDTVRCTVDEASIRYSTVLYIPGSDDALRCAEQHGSGGRCWDVGTERERFSRWCRVEVFLGWLRNGRREKGEGRRLQSSTVNTSAVVGDGGHGGTSRRSLLSPAPSKSFCCRR